jgi:hypothetical protein
VRRSNHSRFCNSKEEKKEGVGEGRKEGAEEGRTREGEERKARKR